MTKRTGTCSRNYWRIPSSKELPFTLNNKGDTDEMSLPHSYVNPPTMFSRNLFNFRDVFTFDNNYFSKSLSLLNGMEVKRS